MTAYHLARSPRRSATPGPCLTTRPAADAIIAMLFGLTVLIFLVALATMSV